jgi:V/A-type H+-transporting ATPase subunit G/H
MATKELDSILEAERAAAEAIDSAKAKAKEVLARADKEAERLLQETIEDAQSKAKSLLDCAAKSVAELERTYLEEAQREISSLREAAGAKMDAAAMIIVSKVKKAV